MRKLCTYPCCRNVTTDGNPRCEKHRTKPKSNAAIERAQFYKSCRWTSFSKSIRKQRPVCELCQKELTEHLDHWLEVSLDKEYLYTFDERNMVCLCRSCHTRKTFQLHRLIKNDEYHKLYHKLLSEHPRPLESGYLHDWIKARTEEAKTNRAQAK
ncbi:HNH endonuclease [Vibrio vulnificus]|nr:HNH endonuclease [Vibrio vulnificus]